MDEAVDRAAYLNYFLTELIYPPGQKLQRRLRQLQVTDCRSLYDAVLLEPGPDGKEDSDHCQVHPGVCRGPRSLLDPNMGHVGRRPHET